MTEREMYENYLKKLENPPENVNHPPHYSSETDSGIECIDGMLAAFGYEEVMSFCKINAFKYLWRMKRKNGMEDFNKAMWYLKKYYELCQEYQKKSGKQS